MQDCFEGVFGADFMGSHAKPDAEAFQKASMPWNYNDCNGIAGSGVAEGLLRLHALHALYLRSALCVKA